MSLTIFGAGNSGGSVAVAPLAPLAPDGPVAPDGPLAPMLPATVAGALNATSAIAAATAQIRGPRTPRTVAPCTADPAPGTRLVIGDFGPSRYSRPIASKTNIAASSDASDAIAPGAVQVRRALLSVSDKRGIVEFAQGLAELGVEIVSTGGTAKELREAGIEVRAIDDFTGFPEIMDGRVKTLHPKLYAGLLAVRDNPEHLRQAGEQDVEFVELVCVNLYPFERTAARADASDAEVIENIDIGGPTMIRAAAKNHAYAAVVVRPESYDAVLEELRNSDGRLSMETRASLAAEAFASTARYDTAIARWFAEREADEFPPLYVRAYEKVVDLSYGENPHQRAAYYSTAGARTHLLSMVRQHHGKQLSYNNLLDLDAARRLSEDLAGSLARGAGPSCVIVKHNNPCGCALATTALEAYRNAFACDPLSAYGGVIVLNSRIDRELAEALNEQFIEVLFAPAYDEDALEVLMSRKNIRLLEAGDRRVGVGEPEVRQVAGGLLVQDRDNSVDRREDMHVATSRVPSEDQWEDLLFAWRVCKHVRSNAIVLAKDLATVGVGAGQMSRVDSVRLAVEKAQPGSVQGSVLASDAFFPFADGPELAVDAGVVAVIQPGGSIRDDDVIAAAEAAGIAMVMTGRRHFKH
jgi:phosphoribosylaminoimidazolecarboxamide formyltransferase/IMP cyclohydrolase